MLLTGHFASIEFGSQGNMFMPRHGVNTDVPCFECLTDTMDGDGVSIIVTDKDLNRNNRIYFTTELR